MTTCNRSRFPVIELLVNDYWVEMLPDDYISASSADPSDKSCFLGLTQGSVDFFVFGDSLMRGYYVIHDDPRATVGLVPYPGSKKRSPVREYSAPTAPIDASKIFGLTYQEITYATMIIAAITTVITVAVMYFKRQVKDDE